MDLSQKGLYLLTLVIWFITKSQSKTTFCGRRKPVIKICTSNTLTEKTSVNIDSWSVPLYQNISCKCTISPSNLSVGFIFTLKETTTYENTLFEINNIVFDANTKEEDKQKTTILYGETDLMFSTSGTEKIALCLIVSSENEVRFDITCLKQTFIKTTTERPLSSASTLEDISALPSASTVEDTSALSSASTVEDTSGLPSDSTAEDTSALPSASTVEDTSTLSSASTVEDTNSEEEQVLYEDKNEQNKTFLVPVLAASAGVVCICVAVVVIVICRRRSISEKPRSDMSTTVAEKQNDDDYYMTENPMYDATEIPRKIPNSESEYHYIEHDNHGGCDESIPGTLVGKQISQNHGKPDLHYDYTTCISAIERNKHLPSNKTCENNAGNKKEGGPLENKRIVDDTVYDCIVSAKTKQFVSVDEYHHLSSVASKKEGGPLKNKRIVDDTVYDCTVSAKTKQFVSVDEYHHLSSVASKTKRVPETYDTVGNVKNDHQDQEDKIEKSDYHVTNFTKSN